MCLESCRSMFKSMEPGCEQQGSAKNVVGFGSLLEDDGEQYEESIRNVCD